MSTQIARFAPAKLEPAIYPLEARTMAVQMLPNLTIAKGTVLGQVTSAGGSQSKFGAYAAANADGTQLPVGLAVYDFTTDANGMVVLGGAGAAADLIRSPEQTAEIYWKGTFFESDLVGLDANAVTKFVAREFGVGTAKMVHIP
jgi:hypothetical protein